MLLKLSTGAAEAFSAVSGEAGNRNTDLVRSPILVRVDPVRVAK